MYIASAVSLYGYRAEQVQHRNTYVHTQLGRNFDLRVGSPPFSLSHTHCAIFEFILCTGGQLKKKRGDELVKRERESLLFFSFQTATVVVELLLAFYVFPFRRGGGWLRKSPGYIITFGL